MKLKNIFFIILLLISSNLNASLNDAFQDSTVVTPYGIMNLKLEYNPNTGVYNFTLKEPYEPPQIFLQEHPFMDEIPTVAIGSKYIFSNLLKQKMPVVCKYINSELLYRFELYILLDDKKKYNEKGFYVHFRARSQEVVQVVLKELTADRRLIEIIREGCDWLYKQVPPTVRYEDLSKYEQSLVNEGKSIHYLPVIISMEKEDLQ